MIAYKGFAPDFTASFGSGKKQYHVGDVLEEDSSKTARTGMHCAEYVLDCLRWYPLGNGNRYCQVEARGSIDEDGSVQIACTKMHIVRELNTKQIASAACMYMVSFPERDWKPDVDGDISGWQYTSCGEIPGIKGDVDLDVAYEDPAAWTQPTGESRVILCVSIADTYDKAVAENISAAYPGCKVHRVQALDAGGIEMWVASVADVWTREQAEILRQQFEAMGINGIIHEVRIVE